MSGKIIALGELLIDFTPVGVSENNRPLYEQNPGGAPANVLTAAARQGASTGIISAVGNDTFGKTLIETMNTEGVDTSGIQIIQNASTTLAFVSLDSHGDRSFCFIRKPGADMLLNRDSIHTELFRDCHIFHFGSLSLNAAVSYEATIYGIQAAQQINALISFDLNWRENLWTDKHEGLAVVNKVLPFTHLLKLSEEELELVTGIKDLALSTGQLFTRHGSLKLIVVTLGANGCYYRTKDASGYVPGFKVDVIDTTGAGDAFWGSCLASICNTPKIIDNKQSLEKALSRANASGALCTTKHGAIFAMPYLRDIELIMAVNSQEFQEYTS